ncbi:hypothetical protein T4A_10992 [Trichinella pseudospiralis]|uniref:Uncharacterized protein n=1 Tax=Trichinella pseudospiralis TaxID=6337 RepID=A0A0V1DT26_TRIPS|nr:hypothetical protein T4A_10992 [Trichinella pseudospiralis]
MPLGGTPFAISQSMHYGDAYLWPVELWGLHKRIRSEQAGSLTTLKCRNREASLKKTFFSTQSGVKLPPPEATAVSPDWSLFPLNRIFKQRAVYLSSTLG